MFPELPGGDSRESHRASTEELLAEAAMRSALAAEKQAEAVTQAVDILHELVALLRERVAPPSSALVSLVPLQPPPPQQPTHHHHHPI